MEIDYRYHDGGRSMYFKGNAGDCVVRAISISTNTDYKVIYDELYQLNKDYKKSRNNKVSKKMKSGSPRNGNFKKVYHDYILGKGYRYVPLIKFGSKERTRLDQLSKLKNIIVCINNHIMTMKDGIVYDTWDTRYSYWEGVKAIRTVNAYYERIEA